MQCYFNSCPLGLECLDEVTDDCINLNTCMEHARAWLLPYKYQRINSIDVLTVEFDFDDIYDHFFYEEVSYSLTRIQEAYQQAGWYPACTIPSDEYPKVDYCENIPF